MTPAPQATLAAALAAVTLLWSAACGGSDPATFGAEGAWARTTPAGAANGVVYLTLSSDTDDELIAVEVPSGIADHAELHVTELGDGGGGHVHGGGDSGDVATMTQIEALPIAAGETITFEPGGNHIMLIELAKPLQRAERFELTLAFQSGRSLLVPVTVADNPPGTGSSRS